MTVSRKLFRNFSLLLAGNVVGQLAFLFGLVHIARALGPPGFGSWNFAQTWLLYLFRAGEIGVEVLAIREISKHPEQTAEWMKMSYCIRITIAVGLYFLTLGLEFLGLFPSYSTRLIAVFSLGVLVWSFTLEWVLEGRQEVAWVSFARVLKGVLFAVPVYFFVRTTRDASLSAWAYVWSLAVSVAIIALIVFRRYGWSHKRISVSQMRQVLFSAFPVGLATIFSQYSMFFGTFVVGYLLNESEVGYFSAGHRIIVFIWAYVIVSSNRVILPTLARYFLSSQIEFQTFMRKFFRLCSMVAVPIGLLGTLAAPTLFPILYGNEYSSSVLVFQVLIWGLEAAMVRSIFEVGMIASEDQRLYLRVTAIQAFVYTCTSIILTSVFGILGTAAACLLSEVAILFYVVVIYSHARRVSYVQDLWKPLVSLSGSALVWVVLSFSPYLRNIASLLTYVIIFTALKGITADDVRLFKSVLGLDRLVNSVQG